MLIRIAARRLDNVMGVTSNIINNHDETIQKLLEQVGDDVIDEARAILHSKDHINTGELISSLGVFDVQKHSLVVGAAAPHAPTIEFGRGPVKPIRAKVLTWIDPKTGERVFSMFSSAVNASPFLEPAVVTQSRKFSDLYVTKMESEIRTFL